MVVLIRLTNQENFAGTGRIELFQFLRRVSLCVQNQYTFLLLSVEHGMDAVSYFRAWLHALNQYVAILVLRVGTYLQNKHRNHFVETDNYNMLFKRIRNITFAIMFYMTFQHV